MLIGRRSDLCNNGRSQEPRRRLRFKSLCYSFHVERRARGILKEKWTKTRAGGRESNSVIRTR